LGDDRFRPSPRIAVTVSGGGESRRFGGCWLSGLKWILDAAEENRR